MPSQVLRASVADVRSVASLLRPIAFSQLAHVIASDFGLEFITQKDRSVQAHAYLSSSLFESFSFHLPRPDPRPAGSASRQGPTPSSELPLSYPSEDPRIPKRRRLLDGDDSDQPREAAGSQQEEEQEEEDPPQVEFEINLHNLLECLNIFGGAAPSHAKGSTLNMTGPGPGGGAGAGGGYGAAARDRERYGGGTPFGAGKEMVRVDRDKNATAMVMSYRGEGEPLILLLTESAVETRCELSTFVPEAISTLSFDHYRMVGQAIISSDWLHDAFLGIDASCREVAVRFSPSYQTSSNGGEARARGLGVGGGDSSVSITQSSGSTTIEAAAAARGRAEAEAAETEAGQMYARREGRGNTLAPSSSSGSTVKEEQLQQQQQQQKGKTRSVQMFKITADGDFGSAEFDFPNDRGVMEKFVARYDHENLYRFDHFNLAQRALGSSVKTSVRVDDQGLLSFQFLMPLGEAGKAGAAAGAGGGGAASALNRSFVELVWVPLDSSQDDND